MSPNLNRYRTKNERQKYSRNYIFVYQFYCVKEEYILVPVYYKTLRGMLKCAT